MPEILTGEDKNNGLIDGTENLWESSKQLDNHQDSNTAYPNKTKVEGKFVRKKMLLTCQEIYLNLKVCCYSKV